MRKIIKLYTGLKPFTDDEAWLLFKLAAFAEAIGWTLLITGILLSQYVFGGSHIPVALAGRTHGILFMLYIVAVLVLAPSLGWKWKRTLIAGLMSVPPYGTLAVELWTSHGRRRKSLINLGLVLKYQQITKS
jgi:integral membrane protein